MTVNANKEHFSNNQPLKLLTMVNNQVYYRFFWRKQGWLLIYFRLQYEEKFLFDNYVVNIQQPSFRSLHRLYLTKTIRFDS